MLWKKKKAILSESAYSELILIQSVKSYIWVQPRRSISKQFNVEVWDKKKILI
jgi:hypothetical protein